MKIFRISTSIGVALLLLSCEPQDGVPQTLEEAYAAQQYRPCALRLVGLPYRPPGATPAPSRKSLLNAAATRVLAAPAVPAHRHAIARFFAGGSGRARAELQKLTVEQPSDADLWSDLAVLQFESAQEPASLVTALACADRAVELQPSHSAAAFNRAYILGELHLHDAEAAAWQRFLRLESNSQWSSEARERLRRAQRTPAFVRWQKELPNLERGTTDIDHVTQEYPEYVRRWGESIWLANWADAVLAGNSAAARKWLTIVRACGASLARVNREMFLDTVVRHVETATHEELARAFVEYRQARSAINSRHPSVALARLESAERRFRSTGSPMWLQARYYRAGAMLDARKPAEARALLDTIEAGMLPQFRALHAQVLAERARVEGRQGNDYTALRLAQSAYDEFCALGEPDLSARAASEVAAKLAALGQPVDAWEIRMRAFEKASASGRDATVESVLHAAAHDEILERRYAEAGSLFHVLAESQAYSPKIRFDAMLWKTYIDARTSQAHDRVLEWLRAAAANVPDVFREEAEDDLRFVEALLFADRDAARAIRLLDESVAFRRRANRLPRVADALVLRARAERTARMHHEARRDLDAALAVFEVRRSEVEAPDLRDSFFDAAGDACRQLVELNADADDADAAFDAAERCRARVLLDLVVHEPLTARSVQSRLNSNTAIVHYTAAGENVVITAMTSGRLAVAKAPRRESWESLIAPVARLIRPGMKLVIVPDEETSHMSFSRLRAPSERYVIEDHELTIAPSASLWVIHRSSVAARARDVLVVGDPAFQPAPQHDLARLPGAAREATAVAALHSSATTLLGRDATEPRVAEWLQKAAIVHIASHALVSARDARNSALLLAPAGDADGLLTVRELESMRLQQQPLIVLAGCTTATRGGGKGSITTLAAAFLAIGARAVAGALTDVDDDPTSQFSMAFHRALRAGDPPARALRRAQLEMLASSDPRLNKPEVWGAFQLYGFE